MKENDAKFWKDGNERKEASRIRDIHPDWTNKEIKDFMYEQQHKELQEKFEKLKGVHNKNKAAPPISLRELIDNSSAPTGYVSPLTDIQWINHYLNIDLLLGLALYKVQEEISNHFDTYLWSAADVWRGVGKTVLSFGKIIRRPCDNPNLKLALICEDQPKAKARLGVLKTILQTNRKIIEDYGYLPHDRKWQGSKGKWSSFKIQLKRDIIAQEPTVMALSQDSSELLGYHLDGVLLDDPWSEKLQRQKGSKEKWLSWFQGTLLGCIEAGAFVWMLFTRKGVDDLYDDLIYKQGLFRPFKKPAIQKYPSRYEYIFDEAGFPVMHTTPVLPFYPRGYGVPKVKIATQDGIISDACNGRFSMEYLLGKRKQAGTLKFEQEFQCNPMPQEGSLLDWNGLQFYNDPSSRLENAYEYPKFDSMSYIGFMDQAYGLTDRADYSVIAILGYQQNRIYLEWLYRGRWRLADKISNIRQAFTKYPRLTKLGIESGLTQTLEAKRIIDMCPELPLVPVEQRGAGRNYNLSVGSNRLYDPKILRIHDQWSPVLIKRNFYINRKMPYFDEFEKEFRFLGNAAHDDIMDTIGSGLEMLTGSMCFKYVMSGGGSSGPVFYQSF